MGGVTVVPINGVDTIYEVELLEGGQARGDVQDTGKEGVKVDAVAHLFFHSTHNRELRWLGGGGGGGGGLM